ncbi:MAG: TIGR04086 family membrane protein [Lachnospiraceae bacterium]|nr:TIGR04086 family membrane protein [Lachnospiraceae bacterium]
MAKTTKILEVIKYLVVIYIITGVALAALAFVIYKWNLPENIVNIVILAIYAVATFIGGLLIGKRMQERKFLWGLILGACYILIIYGVSLILSASLNMVSTTGILAAVLSIAGGLLGGMLS